ncbi:MAG: hypothetical protein V4513_08725 [Pseudomonadota bacterium]
MRTIPISTDVFQAIWAARQPGEEDEDAVLRRILKTGAAKAESSKEGVSGGLTDPSYGVHFPEGFEVFRTYLGKDYRARVQNGRWVIDGKPVTGTTINQLSAAIGILRENGWANWEFQAPTGQVKKIGELRDPSRIRRRRRAMF